MFYIDHKPVLVNEKTKIDNWNMRCIKFLYIDINCFNIFNETSKILSHVNSSDVAALYKINSVFKTKSVVQDGIIRYLSATIDTNKYHDNMFDLFCYIDPRPFKIEKQYSRINKIRSFV